MSPVVDLNFAFHLHNPIQKASEGGLKSAISYLEAEKTPG